MRSGSSNALLFSSKAALSAVLAYYLFNLFGLPGAAWSSISAVLVTQPSLHPSMRASLLRCLANIVGALLGAVVLTLIKNPIPAMALGVVLTGLVCHFARLDDALRPAYAAVVIVTLLNATSVWFGSLDRLLAVVLGCLCTLFVSLIFDKFIDRFIAHLQRFIPGQDSGD